MLSNFALSFIQVSYKINKKSIEEKCYDEHFPVSDLRNYNERGRAEKKLLVKLQEAEEAVKDGEGWLNLDDLKMLMME